MNFQIGEFILVSHNGRTIGYGQIKKIDRDYTVKFDNGTMDNFGIRCLFRDNSTIRRTMEFRKERAAKIGSK